jgi:hypothetical protein
MKIFKQGSMMEEHRQQQARARRKTAGMSANAFQHVEKVFWKCFEINVQILMK